MPVFRQILPSSERDQRLEKYEYYLVWTSPFGGVRQWLFTNTDVTLNDNYKSEILETFNSIRSVPMEETNTVKLMATSLTELEFEYIKTIMQSNLVFRVAKDQSRTSVAVVSGRVRRKLMQKEYTIEVTIQFREPELLNV